MSKLPLVSIGLPFYNNENTIEDAVKSVLAQTYENWELIIVNDGGTDNSYAKLKNLYNHPKITWINDGTNKGLIARLNQISNIAKGEYLARMDADDMIDPQRIEKQMNYLLQHPDVDLVDTATWSTDLDGVPNGKRGFGDIATDPKDILRHAMLLHASVVGKTKWFRENPYDKDFVRAEDYELWCRTYKKSKFGRIKEPLYIVREGKVNLKAYKKSMETLKKVFNKYGKDVFTPAELKKELFKINLKVFAYDVFSFFNQQDFLSKRRNNPLSASEQAQAEQIIARIRSIEL